MCARYTLRKRRLAEVAERLDAEVLSDDEALYKPRFNVAPTDLGWIVACDTGRRVLRPARWKYETASKRLLVNIRGETIGMGRFRDAFTVRRCAVVTDGFYEWPPGRGEPFWFHARDDQLLLLGGLLQPSKITGAVPRFSVLTTTPNTVVRPVHDRMPVIIDAAQIDEWLTADTPAALRMLVPSSPRVLVRSAVSAYVNSVRHDDAACIAPRQAPAQGSLF